MSDKITIFKNHSPRRAIAGKDKLIELGYEDATISDSQAVFDAMLYVPGTKAYEGWDEETSDFNTRLLGLIADIRFKSGVGQNPMLSELADAIAEEITRLRASHDATWNEAIEAAILKAEHTPFSTGKPGLDLEAFDITVNADRSAITTAIRKLKRPSNG